MDSATWVVVLNWNGRQDTLELLDGLSGCGATVLVVDNGSTDGTLEAVRAGFPDVRTLQNFANLGYAGGNNAGIRLALRCGADTIVVLNNDTVVEPDALGPLVDAVRHRPIAASPDIRYASDPDISWFRGSKIDARTGWPVHLQPDEQADGRESEIRTPLLTGCCIAASRDTWNHVGLFDDGMFLIFEDSDWSMRARQSGVELAVIPASRIFHKVSRSFIGTANLYGSYYFARNGTTFALRHLGYPLASRFIWFRVVRPALSNLAGRGNRRAGAMALVGLAATAFGRRGPVGRVGMRVARTQ